MISNCLTQEYLHSYYDEEVSTDEKDRISDHLLSCEKCNVLALNVKSELAFIYENISLGMHIDIPTESILCQLKLAIAESAEISKWNKFKRKAKDIFWMHGFPPPIVAAGGLIIICLASGLFFLSRESTSHITTNNSGQTVDGLAVSKEVERSNWSNPSIHQKDTPKRIKLTRREIRHLSDTSITPPPRRERSAFFDSETTEHLEKAHILLRSFKNSVMTYGDEKEKSRKLLRHNAILRRYATSEGNIPVKELLEGLEPYLLDISNLPVQPSTDDLLAIKDRITDGKIIAILHLYSNQFDMPGSKD